MNFRHVKAPALPLVWRSTMGARPDAYVPALMWCPWAALQTYEGLHYYTASLKLWSADGEYTSEATLPFRYPTQVKALEAAVRFCEFLTQEQPNAEQRHHL